MQPKSPEPVAVDVEKLTPDQAAGIATQIAKKFGPTIVIHGAGPQRAPSDSRHIYILQDGAIMVMGTDHQNVTENATAGRTFYGTGVAHTPLQHLASQSVEGYVARAVGPFEQVVYKATATPHGSDAASFQTLSSEAARVEDEGSEADWQAVKEEVMRLLSAEALDTPASHLAYVRERLKPVFDHVES